VFYINVPIAVIVIALAARTIPQLSSGRKPVIDYLGCLFVALGATGLTLATSWGGTQYAWGSATIIGLFAASVAALAIFVWVELRAAEPILPMRLFRSRVFTVCSVLSFIVGFAMIGSITFMPTFLQYVNGVSATASGLRMLPMVIGLLATALVSGAIVGRTGRYRLFPIAGSAVTAVGLYLLSRMDQHTSAWVESASLLVLGAGIGLIMQILTLVVQNTVAYSDLGTATSGVTFFRTLGGSFGASIMGSIYANGLQGRLAPALAASHVPPSAVNSPEAYTGCRRRPDCRSWPPTPSRCSTCSCSRCRSRWSRWCSRCSCPRSRCAGWARPTGSATGSRCPRAATTSTSWPTWSGRSCAGTTGPRWPGSWPPPVLRSTSPPRGE
jgi:hypothetical protein